MIPIRDHNPSGIQPRITQGLIALNLAVFLYSHLVLKGADQDIFLFNYSFIPFRLHFHARLETLLTAMFLHAGWLHLGGNMLFLWIFGDNVEARFGRLGFLAFYLGCGVAAALAQFLHDPYARTTVLGASGAIAGVLGAYLRFYPRARVDVFFFFVIFWKTLPIPAWLVLGAWIAMQTWSGLSDPMLTDGVAYWEHIGGFATGFLIALLFKRPAAAHHSAEPRLNRSAIPPVPRRP